MTRRESSPEFIEYNKTQDTIYNRFYMSVAAPAAIFMSYATMRAFLNGENLLALASGAAAISFLNFFRIGLNGNAREDWEETKRTNRYIVEAVKTIFKK